MTTGEWFEFCERMTTAFPQEFSAKRAEVYAEMLDAGDRPLADFLAGLKLLIQRGQKWLPSAGELSAAITEATGGKLPGDLGAPAFAQVLAVLDGARFRGHRGVLSMQQACGTTAAAWMAAEGPVALQNVQLAHPEYGAAAAKELGRRYAAFVADQTACARRNQPLASVDERGLLLLPNRGRGLRKLDPSQGLGQAPSQRELPR